MTDTAGDNTPFPGFPGFPPAEMLDRMWDMMRLTPFGAAFPGMHPGTAQGIGSPLAAMSDMMTPLMSVEELDKRIVDMRAVEQWLKLNLNILQSAIQALEVQRATLATLRAFGAFAQESMRQPAHGEASESTASPLSSAWGARPAERPVPEEAATEKAGEQEGAESGAAAAAPFDPSTWWNLLQSQFNQLANFAMTVPGASESEASKKSVEPDDPPAGSGASRKAGATNGKRAASSAKSAAKRPAARKSGGKTSGSSSATSEK
jgi:hypothetical protein